MAVTLATLHTHTHTHTDSFNDVVNCYNNNSSFSDVKNIKAGTY